MKLAESFGDENRALTRCKVAGQIDRTGIEPMQKISAKRRGLTIVEIIVGCLILGFLVVFVLASINWTRQKSLNNTTKNRLRQIGFGTLSYENTNKAYPHH